VEDLATVIPHALRSYLEHAHVDAHVLGRAWIGNRWKSMKIVGK